MRPCCERKVLITIVGYLLQQKRLQAKDQKQKQTMTTMMTRNDVPTTTTIFLLALATLLGNSQGFMPSNAAAGLMPSVVSARSAALVQSRRVLPRPIIIQMTTTTRTKMTQDDSSGSWTGDVFQNEDYVFLSSFTSFYPTKLH